ncbi:DUF6428 family protein [Flavobacteriaceae bacterium GF1]
MQTKELLETLESHQNKSLLFEYRQGEFVKANYHITEIKNTIVDSVDCGANTDYWKETVIQLYESPVEKDKKEFMTVRKALSILNRVDKIKPMAREAEVKFEYSNDNFHTAQLFVNDLLWNANELVIKLAVEKTDCKAKETCGIPEEVVSDVAVSCVPGSGCC